MLKMWQQKIDALHPCFEAQRWIHKQKGGYLQAWKDCLSGEWMFWLMGAAGLEGSEKWNKAREAYWITYRAKGQLGDTRAEAFCAKTVRKYYPKPPRLSSCHPRRGRG